MVDTTNLSVDVDVSEFTADMVDWDYTRDASAFSKWLDIRGTLVDEGKKSGVALCDGYLSELAPVVLGETGLAALESSAATGCDISGYPGFRSMGLVERSGSISAKGRIALAVVKRG